MANKSEAQEEAEVHGSGKKKRVLLFAGVGAVMLALAGGGAAWFFLSGKPEGAEAHAEPKEEHPPVFVRLDPFVVNLAGEVEHYLQVGIELKVADAKVPDQVKARLPEIRNAVLLLLSSKHAEELATLEGKNQLREQIRAAINAPLGVATAAALVPPPAAHAAVGEAHASDAPPAPAATAPAATAPAADEHPAGVLDVLLTSFVIQ